jgi:hypothetical protein
MGDLFYIGEGMDDWSRPATLMVTSVGDGGTLADLDITDGGDYIGDDCNGVEGDYNLTPINAASLQLRARSGGERVTVTKQSAHSALSAPATANSKPAQYSLPESWVVVGSAAGACLLLLIASAAFILKRRSAVAKQCNELNLSQDHGMTPPSLALSPAKGLSHL